MELDIIKLIGDYGIQTLMLVWFMFRTERVISKNTEALKEINGVIRKCQK